MFPHGEQRTACLCRVRGWSEKDYVIVWDGSWGGGLLMKKDLGRHLVWGSVTAHRSDHDYTKLPPSVGAAAEGERLFSQTGCMNYSSTRLCRIEQEST